MSEVLHNGLILTAVSVCVVFGALTILYFVYTIIGKVVNKEFHLQPGKISADSNADSPSEEEIAAMTAAVDMYIREKDGDAHDFESGMITIKR